MIIDTHCHIDLYNKPEQLIKQCEAEGITLLAMTNLPSHFEQGLPYFKHQKKIRLSLGMHPLYSLRHEEEFPKFIENLKNTSYIGEVGLDFSKEGYKTKELQIKTFTNILQSIAHKKKILNLHSRRAENKVLELLKKYKVENAIFHWYSGPTTLIPKILEAGYFFSVNPSMIDSTNGKKIISMLPLERILSESDGPFVNFQNRVIHPRDIKCVINFISASRDLNKEEVEKQISRNFNSMIKKIL